MSISEQVDALQKRVAELKSSADQARQETNEQVKARITQAKADIAARESVVKEKTEQAADQTQNQWKKLQADNAAKMLAGRSPKSSERHVQFKQDGKGRECILDSHDW